MLYLMNHVIKRSQCLDMSVVTIKEWFLYSIPYIPKYWDTSTPYHTCKIRTNQFYFMGMCLKIADECWSFTNRIVPDPVSLSAASNLGLHCFLRPYVQKLWPSCS